MDLDLTKCCNCGKEFSKQKKSYGRRSLGASAKLKKIDKTLKDIIEEEFTVTITPDSKNQRFLCESCSWMLVSMAKSSVAKQEALERLKGATGGTTYLAKKLRSPVLTPRKIKRLRTASPQKPTTSSTDPASHTVQPTQTFSTKTKPKSVPLTRIEADVQKALGYIRRRQYSRGLSALMAARVGFKNAVNSMIQQTVRKEVSRLCQNAQSIFKGGKSLEEMKNFSWETRYQEGVKECPMLTNVLIGATTTKNSSNYLGLASNPSTSAKPTIGTLLAIILYQRKPRIMYDLQELNSIQMWLAGCKREMFSRFEHLGLATGIKGTRHSLDRVRKEYDCAVFEWKRTVTDYLLLPSETSASDTIPYATGGDDLDSLPSIESILDQEHTSSTKMHVSTQLSPQPSDSPQESDHDNRSSLSQQQETDESTTKTSKIEHEGRFGFSLCFDNVNQKTTVRHQTRDKRNKIFNMVQAYAARDRIPTTHLSDAWPTPQDILKIPLERYLPSEMDEVDLRFEMTIVVIRVLCDHIPAFKRLSGDINWHMQHRYSKESSSKSNLVPLGVLDKDESQVSDTIDIMDEYHKYVPVTPNGDPMTVILHADGLSVERGNNAQCARINANSPWQQLQGLTMNIQEWHKRCLLLQDIYDELYSGSSGREKGTLYQLKNYFNHRGVTTNIKESFNHSEEFLDFCTNGYLVLAAMHFMSTSDIEEKPQDFPSKTEEEVHFLNKIAGKIVDMVFLSSQPTVKKIVFSNGEDSDECPSEYCVCRTEKPGLTMVFCDNKACPNGIWFHLECLDMEETDVPEGKWWCTDECRNSKPSSKKRRKTVAGSLQDNKRNYAIKVLWHGLNQKIKRDAIRENDGSRIIRHWKFDLLGFYENHHPKYFLVCHQLLSAINGAVSPRLQQTLIWNRTVNPNGGLGKNMEMDLQMEHYNKQYKESVKDAAGQLTQDTIARHSQMVGIGKLIRQVYEKQVSGGCKSGVQSKSDIHRDSDIKEFVVMMKDEKVFSTLPGRNHPSFPDITLNLYPKTQPKPFKARLVRLRKEMSMKRDITLQMQRN